MFGYAMVRDMSAGREMGDTLRHQILENFDMAIGSSGMPGSGIHIRRIRR
jgi:hypothetical protein